MIVPPLAAHRMIRKRLAGHAVGAGPTSNRTHGPVTRRGDVQLPDVAHAARERGAIGWLGQCNRPRGSEHSL